MENILMKNLTQIDAVQRLLKARALNLETAREVLTNPEEILIKIQNFELAQSMFKSPFALPDESVDGLIRFAFTENNFPVGFELPECHTLLAGQTGCGKSTLLRIIFDQALMLNKINNNESPFMDEIVCWLFVKAPDMRSLLETEENILIVNFQNIKLNPLEPPPGMNVMEWTNVFADFWIQAFGLYEASKGFLIECLENLYSKYSTLGYYPSLFDLYYYVRAMKFTAISRTARYQESVLNRLGGLLKSSLASIFDCSRGHVNNLINQHTIFEIPFLATEQQVFIVNYLVSYLFCFKLINENALRHFVGIDDSNTIFDSSFEKRPDMGLPIIHQLLSTIRKSKINVFACTQTPHQIGAALHSNAFAKIMFSLSNGKDIDFMQQGMGIKEPEQQAYCFKLKPREAVIRFASRFQEPFVINIPEVDL